MSKAQNIARSFGSAQIDLHILFPGFCAGMVRGDGGLDKVASKLVAPGPALLLFFSAQPVWAAQVTSLSCSLKALLSAIYARTGTMNTPGSEKTGKCGTFVCVQLSLEREKILGTRVVSALLFQDTLKQFTQVFWRP